MENIAKIAHYACSLEKTDEFYDNICKSVGEMQNEGLKVDVTKTDAFNEFVGILKGVMEDERVPDGVKRDIKNRVDNLLKKHEEDNINAKIK